MGQTARGLGCALAGLILMSGCSQSSIQVRSGMVATPTADVAGLQAQDSWCAPFGERSVPSPSATLIASPNDCAIAPSSALNGISCATSTACFAVGGLVPRGSETASPLMVWDGSRWFFDGATVPADTRLTAGYVEIDAGAVSCSTAADCIIAGMRSGSPSSAVAERWDGHRWTMTTMPVPEAAVVSSYRGWDAFVSAATCPSVSRCFAVVVEGGFGLDTSSYASLFETWNGSSWQVLPSPSSVGLGTDLGSISCPSIDTCFVAGNTAGGIAGNFTSRPVIARWSGGHWTRVPGPPGLDYATSISCVGSGQCVVGGAQGNYLEGGLTTATVDRLDGNVWTVATGPPSSGVVSDVYCIPTGICVAAGTATTSIRSFPFGKPTVEFLHGTQLVTQPVAPSTPAAQLTGATCVPVAGSQPQCLVAGLTSTGETLVEGDASGRWARYSAPDPTIVSSVLNAVACPSSAECIAVGRHGPVRDELPLAEQWNGTGWSIVPTLAAGVRPDAALLGVACASRTLCFAVGTTATGADGPEPEPLLARWSGPGTPLAQIVGAPAALGATLSGIVCTSQMSCTAAGRLSSGRLFVETFNGTRWSVPTSASGALAALSSRWYWSGSSFFPAKSSYATDKWMSASAIACASPRECIAVGPARHPWQAGQFQVWSGHRWKAFGGPSFIPGPLLIGVACPTASLCWAVGRMLVSEGSLTTAATLIEKLVPPS